MKPEEIEILPDDVVFFAVCMVHVVCLVTAVRIIWSVVRLYLPWW